MKIPKKKILSLLEKRRKAGEKLMNTDSELHNELLKLGVDIGGIEYGLNSIFLITEPSACEDGIKAYVEEQLGCTLDG